MKEKDVYLVKHTGGVVAYRERWIGESFDEAVSFARELAKEEMGVWIQKDGKAQWDKGKESIFVTKRTFTLPEKRWVERVDELLKDNARLEAMVGTSPQYTEAQIKRRMFANHKEIQRLDPDFERND